MGEISINYPKPVITVRHMAAHALKVSDLIFFADLCRDAIKEGLDPEATITIKRSTDYHEIGFLVSSAVKPEVGT